MSKIAYLTHNITTGQYALYCMGRRIAYTEGVTPSHHEANKANLIKAATKTGYTILSK